MNFVENNGKKVAAVLCVASAFPVVATVVAAQEEPGWHGDKYINEDKTTATGWEEIEGKSYYFSEDGTVDTTKTEKATTASVSSNVLGDVKETVATTTTEAVETEKETKAAEEAKVAEEAAKVVETTETTTDETVAPVEDTETTTTEDTTPVVTPEVTPAENTDTVVTAEENTAPVVTPEVTPAESTETVVTPEQTTETVVTPAESTETVVTPEENTEAVVTPVTPEQTTTDTTTTEASLNDRIAAAAQTLVGVTDGQWCTQIVQQALAGAGVSDAYQLWPDQYAAQYGYYTDTPQAGNLIYYNNGGRGVDHIAVYIGNGQAVHGNYDGKTVVASVNINGGAPQYIQVVR